MKHNLKYGSKKINLNITQGKLISVLKQKNITNNQTQRNIILKALSGKLLNKLKGKESAAVLIPDNTRKAGVKIYLPVILRQLKQSGIKPEKIKILIATGSHKILNDAEIKKLIGAEICNAFSIYCNDAYNKEHFYYSGKTRRGTKVLLNKELKSNDIIIATSSILYHYFAGYGGGPKILMPGMAYYKTIEQNHKLSIIKDKGFNVKCKNGNIYDNPVYNDIKESIKDIDNVFYLGTVMNESGRIIHAVSGDILIEHRKGANYLDKYFKVKIKEKADVVICSGGGSPKDINLIQSHKSIHNAFNAVKKNGTIICFTKCSEGVGSKYFMKYFTLDSYSEVIRKSYSSYSLNAQTALAFRYKLERCKVILVTDLNLNKLFNHPNLQSIKPGNINSRLSKLLKNKSYYIIPNANSININ